jgi:hypothetical protein
MSLEIIDDEMNRLKEGRKNYGRKGEKHCEKKDVYIFRTGDQHLEEEYSTVVTKGAKSRNPNEFLLS